MDIIRIFRIALSVAAVFFAPQIVMCAVPDPIRVGVYQNEPKVFVDENGHPKGFFIDIFNGIAGQEGWNVKYVPGSWNVCLDRLENGEIDIMVDVAYSKERDKSFDFNQETILLNWSRLFARKNIKINDIFDLQGKKIAVMKGDISYAELQSNVERYGVTCVFREVESFKRVFEEVDKGNAQAGLISRLFGHKHENEYDVDRTFMVVSPFHLHFAAPQDQNGDILSAIDRHLVLLKQEKNSLYNQALTKWIKSAENVRFPRWINYGASIILVVILILGTFNFILKRQVRSKTRELAEANLELRKHHDQLKSLVEERTAELAAANRELKAFSYSVSHDLRAPLRAIDGFSRLLLEDCVNLLDEEGKGHLKRVCSETKHMKDLIENLLELSRITRSEMLKTHVDLSRLAREIITNLKDKNPSRNVEVSIHEEVVAHGDPTLLRSVLENLLGNAWKYTGRKENARIELGITESDGQKVYFIRDNGAGFNMKYADKLFSPFQRLHRMEEFEGTGIGLATVHRIIHRHGGRVWADGLPGEGATFYFTLL